VWQKTQSDANTGLRSWSYASGCPDDGVGVEGDVEAVGLVGEPVSVGGLA
jgi:hypothetical protein